MPATTRHKDELLATTFKGKGKVEISRFKGLGEMQPAQLQGNHDGPGNKRILLRVDVPTATPRRTGPSMRDSKLVENLMGRKPELRFAFIQENAKFAQDLDV